MRSKSGDMRSKSGDMRSKSGDIRSKSGDIHSKFNINKNTRVEFCALLGYNAASCGNCLPTFRDNVSVPFSRVKKEVQEENETSVNNYHKTPRNTPEERRYHQHRGGSLKSKWRVI
jgi:hypothetical protein